MSSTAGRGRRQVVGAEKEGGADGLPICGNQDFACAATFGELYENHVLPLKRSFGAGEIQGKREELVFENGSRIALGYCDRAGTLRYQGMSLT